MPEYKLHISDDTVVLLLNIGEFMGLSVSEYGTPDISEVLEVVIDNLANSVDSQLETRTTGEGTPIAMQDALEQLMNPNISTVFKAPDTGDVKSTKLTWEQICVLMGEAHPADSHDDITKEAITIVLNELPRDEWASDHAERLIDETIILLSQKKEGFGEK
jgi:hypothetical protein